MITTTHTAARRGLRAALVLALAGTVIAAFSAPAQAGRLARSEAGDAWAPGRLLAGASSRYGWPVKPFFRQHPVRGFFGDPRIEEETFRGDNPGSFHFGVDVSAPDGAPVYATVSGRVVLESFRPETVSVRAGDGTVFAYWHLVPAVRNGQWVEAYRTVVGHVGKGWGHVHFSEVRDDVYVNPLRPGAMGPYADATCPTLRGLRLERDGSVQRGTVARGSVDLVVEAYDAHPVAVPRPWTGKPVTPALVRWRLVTPTGREATKWQTAFDVRSALPPAQAFARVFARWTRQNHPWKGGRYRFVLARSFDSRALRDGRYVAEVAAVDTAGNIGRARFPLSIANRG